MANANIPYWALKPALEIYTENENIDVEFYNDPEYGDVFLSRWNGIEWLDCWTYDDNNKVAEKFSCKPVYRYELMMEAGNITRAAAKAFADAYDEAKAEDISDDDQDFEDWLNEIVDIKRD